MSKINNDKPILTNNFSASKGDVHMYNDNLTKKNSNRGGVREGAGRKKTLPDGAKPSSFLVTEAEKETIKKIIIDMRKDPNEPTLPPVDVEKLLCELQHDFLVKIAYELLKIYGRGNFSKVERLMKDNAIIAFKDAVSLYEKDLPNK